MKERPILMNGAMVRAILEGRKTQTRRLVLDRGHKGEPVGDHVRYWRRGEEDPRRWVGCDGFPIGHVYCPLGDVGGTLWVRESFYEGGCAACEVDAATFSTSASTGHDCRSPRCCSYRADVAKEQLSAVRWTPSIHMPRWASRLTLDIIGVRVERLQDITEMDARAEGARMVPFVPDDGFPLSEGWMFGDDDGKSTLYPSAREAFAKLWDSLYGEEGWKSNPFVWALSYRMVAVPHG